MINTIINQAGEKGDTRLYKRPLKKASAISHTDRLEKDTFTRGKQQLIFIATCPQRQQPSMSYLDY